MWGVIGDIVGAIVDTIFGDEDTEAGAGATSLIGNSIDEPILVSSLGEIPEPREHIGDGYYKSSGKYYKLKEQDGVLLEPPPPAPVTYVTTIVDMANPISFIGTPPVVDLPDPINPPPPRPPPTSSAEPSPPPPPEAPVPLPVIQSGQVGQNPLQVSINGFLLFQPNQNDVCQEDIKNVDFTSVTSDTMIVEFHFPNGEIRIGNIISKTTERNCLPDPPSPPPPPPPPPPPREPEFPPPQVDFEIPEEIPAPILEELFEDPITLDIDMVDLDVPSTNIDPYINPTRDGGLGNVTIDIPPIKSPITTTSPITTVTFNNPSFPPIGSGARGNIPGGNMPGSNIPGGGIVR